jgi:uncharacterized repeat protein (TIGR01451 family)
MPNLNGPFRALGALLFVAGMLLTPSWSQAASSTGEEQPVTAELVAVKVLLDTQGREVFVDAEAANPGDIIEYRVTYRNHTNDLIRGLKATLPLPLGMEYVPQSASPRKVLATVDQTRFEEVPLRRVVRKADGSREVVKIPYDQYRALRWKIDQLKAGRSTLVTARARVATNQ